MRTWSLVAILVGFMVGGAVRKGTGNRGGLLYQFLASCSTYFAIGLMVLSPFSEPIQGSSAEQRARPKPFDSAERRARARPPKPRRRGNEGDRAKGIAPPKQAPGRRCRSAKAEKAGKRIRSPKNKKDAAPKRQRIGRRNVGPVTALRCRFRRVFDLSAASPVITAVQAPISGLIY